MQSGYSTEEYHIRIPEKDSGKDNGYPRIPKYWRAISAKRIPKYFISVSTKRIPK